MFTEKRLKKSEIGLSKIFSGIILSLLVIVIISSRVLVYAANNVGISGRVPLTDIYEQGIKDNSIIIPTPSSTDVGTAIAILVQINNLEKKPLQNHMVSLGIIAVQGVNLVEFSPLTDVNGYIYAQLTSTVAGTFQLYAIDTTYVSSDNTEILINSMPFVTFSNVVTITPTPTTAPRSIVSVTTTPIPTSTVSQTPGLTPTLVTPTIVATNTGSPQTSNNIFFNMIQNIFNYNSCNDSHVQAILEFVLILLFILTVPLLRSAQQLIQSMLYYMIIVVIALILLTYICVPFSYVFLFCLIFGIGIILATLYKENVHEKKN